MGKKVYINENQITLFDYNTPDHINVDGKLLRCGDEDTFAFWLTDDGEFLCAEKGLHSTLIEDYVALELNFGSRKEMFDYIYYNQNNGKNEKELNARDVYKLEAYYLGTGIRGRYWKEENIIAFWDSIPYKKEVEYIVKKLRPYVGGLVDLTTLKIALETELVTFNEFFNENDSMVFDSEKQEQIKALHLMQGDDKSQTSQMQGFLKNRAENLGKKLEFTNKKGEMPMAQYRALHTTSENVEKDKYVIGAEEDGNLGNFHITEAYGQNNSIDAELIDRIDYICMDAEPEEGYDENTYEVECYDKEGNVLYSDSYLTIDELNDVLGTELTTMISNNEGHKSGNWYVIEDIISTRSFDVDNNDVEQVNALAKRLFSHSDIYHGGDRGYILTDGTILEFGPNIDHASISSVGNQTIGSFLKLGNIRIGVQSMELATEPTYEQRKQIRRLVNYYQNEELYVDIITYDGEGMYGKTLTGAKYSNPDYRKVMGEIARFFTEGIKLIGGYNDLTESSNNKFDFAAKLINDGYIIHCTPNKFDKFDSKYIKGGFRANEGYGIYFSDEPYKSITYGDNFKVVKKENFNFINGEDEIDLNWLKSGLDEDLIRSQIAKLEQYKYSPDFNVRFYDEVNEELDVLEKQLEAAHEWNDLFLMIEYTMENYGVKTYVKLDVNLPNQEIWVPKLTKLYISKGIDGYKTGCVYTIFNFDKLNNEVIDVEMGALNEDYRYDNVEDLPDVITLYHGTSLDGINGIIESGSLDAYLGNKRSETYGVNWFSTDPEHKWGVGLISIDVPKEYFYGKDHPRFRLMNRTHVSTTDSIDINQFNFKVLKIGSFDLEELDDLLMRCEEDIYEFQMRLEGLYSEMTNAFDAIDTPLMMWLIKELRGVETLRQEGLMENLQLEVNPEDVDLSTFKKEDELNPSIWKDENTIDSRVRLKLLDIADDFFESLEVSFVDPIDIILTGSICNYNWSTASDIDLHIVIDFSEVDENIELVTDYFDTKKNEWNNNHQNLQIYGFNVEVYVEDINNEKVSEGIYSLEKNKWLSKPNIDNVIDVSEMDGEIKNLASKLMTCIDDIKNEFNNTNDSFQIEEIGDTLNYLKSFIKEMRKQSLKNGGEYSKGNIIYKILRRSGYLKEIFELKNNIYDKLNSIY